MIAWNSSLNMIVKVDFSSVRTEAERRSSSSSASSPK